MHPHGAEPYRLQIRHPGDIRELIGIIAPDPVGFSAEQLGQLGGGVGYFVDLDVADGRPALAAAGVVAVIPLHIDLSGAVNLGDLVGAGADRGTGVAIGTDLLAIGFRPDRRDHRQIFHHGRRHAGQLEADVKVVDLFRAGVGGVIGGDGHLFVVDDVVDSVHYVIGGKRVAVLERDALAQGEVDGGGVDLLPRRG